MSNQIGNEAQSGPENNEVQNCGENALKQQNLDEKKPPVVSPAASSHKKHKHIREKGFGSKDSVPGSANQEIGVPAGYMAAWGGLYGSK